MTQSSRIWFITGISRGLGRALAEEVRAHGDVVIGTTRDGTSDLGAGVHTVPLDLSRPEAPAAAVRAAHAVHGRLDVVVNNAGYGLLGPIEETREEETADQRRIARRAHLCPWAGCPERVAERFEQPLARVENAAGRIDRDGLCLRIQLARSRGGCDP